ncbi:hypothetical protein tb265_13070 [Gemmatimonadetes bacterium T265]|nr:hypothetical protein tb265_13070 [Gemmatimonadetes bacterium T265]
MADDQHVSGARPAGGPDAEDPAYKRLESQRRAPHAQGDSQATAETEDADRAFQESRGNHDARQKPTERS